MNLKEIRGGGYATVFDLDKGANCIRLRHEGLGVRILREQEDPSCEPDNPYLYGMPILMSSNGSMICTVPTTVPTIPRRLRLSRKCAKRQMTILHASRRNKYI